ncbi:DUF1302 family protein [Alkalilimnicola ehrlichii MLHE-1]|uniref:Uncharacterized protein n=1 Tax=Alkalilimnicola ehrlichii (strain ATCC BAA-1101 / DSM 17681 / MLHE-1) TaxID=187272 RepID=Q0A505_ALKEH|nr:DUF1302 family protein [Alkalilimnicola ehrlichii]ABI58082.1 conserved hypothetical protein [Alkalilimnicola ehrlichii MLHE-1]
MPGHQTVRAAAPIAAVALSVLLGVGSPVALAQGDDLWEDDAWGEESWDDDPWEDDPWEEESGLPFDLEGFFEAAGGHHIRNNRVTDKDYNLAEARLQLDMRGDWRRYRFRVRADGVADGVDEELRGELREARVSFPVGDRLDVRAGRQILSWGTGDLLFVNDLFPKDFESFLTGRDEDYLQAPSDALRGTWYGDAVTLDVVWTPVFEPDRFVDGDRLSYFDPATGARTAESLPATAPDDFPDDGELAARLSRRVGGVELAGYLYRGFFPQPSEQIGTADQPRLTHARLNAYGASVRAPVAGGIGNAEIGYYDSVDNRDGKAAPWVPNSQVRFLLGYTRELIANLDLGLQYYAERLQDHDELKARWMADEDYLPEAYRDVVTVRLTYSMWRDDLIWSLFSYLSPADEDYYLRPSVRYRASDAVTYTFGGNLFGGKDRHTFYGQFKRDSNLYARVRFRF